MLGRKEPDNERVGRLSSQARQAPNYSSRCRDRKDVMEPTVFNKVFISTSGGRDVVWVSSQNDKKVLCFDNIDKKLLRTKMANPGNRFNINWSRLGIRDKRCGIMIAGIVSLWQYKP